MDWERKKKIIGDRWSNQHRYDIMIYSIGYNIIKYFQIWLCYDKEKVHFIIFNLSSWCDFFYIIFLCRENDRKKMQIFHLYWYRMISIFGFHLLEIGFIKFLDPTIKWFSKIAVFIYVILLFVLACVTMDRNIPYTQSIITCETDVNLEMWTEITFFQWQNHCQVILDMKKMFQNLQYIRHYVYFWILKTIYSIEKLQQNNNLCQGNSH